MSACVRSGCSGSYLPDGSCDECGYVQPSSERVAPLSTGRSAPARTSVRSRPAGSTSAAPRPSRPITLGRAGDGIVDLPTAPPRDPASALLPADTGVPLHRRRCRTGDHLVGQDRDEGFCRLDGAAYSFSRKLSAGDVVHGRYEVLGCIAFGGLGWIYLARDRNLGDDEAERWVVLKGLIDTRDADAVAAARDEKRFLVEVDHPNIVKIHDFVRHPDPTTGEPVDYIVMEYVGGRSLQDTLRNFRDEDGQHAPLPLPVVLTYGMKVLEALDYLHTKGLVYCDLKPENVLQVRDQIKLIDLGAVIRVARPPNAIYGTPGYQAPELDREQDRVGPSVASDLYTVGRTLAVLAFAFGGFSTEYRHALPDRFAVPLLAEEDSFHRLLCRATHEDPDRRFASAAEMREQVYGVLREVLGDGTPAPSTLFTPERQTFGTGAGVVGADDTEPDKVDWTSVPQALPTPLVDLSDPCAAFLGTLGGVEPAELVTTLSEGPQRSPELLLRLVDTYLATGEPDRAAECLAEARTAGATPWRVAWYEGLAALAADRIDEARTAFESVYDALPGELAPKLALAAAVERAGDDDGLAELLYDRVWHTDHDHLSAAFGLARMLRRTNRWAEAVEVLDGVPVRLAQYVSAQVATIRLRLAPSPFTRADLLDASVRLGRLKMEQRWQARMSLEVLHAALTLVLDHAGANGDPDGRADTVLGHDFDERHLRFGLEKAYRDLANLTDDRDQRSALVDQANRIRPKTFV